MLSGIYQEGILALVEKEGIGERRWTGSRRCKHFSWLRLRRVSSFACNIVKLFIPAVLRHGFVTRIQIT